MEEYNAFLKFIFHEDLYIIDEPNESVDIEIPEKPVPNREKEPPSIIKESNPVTFFGHNEKEILILFHEPENRLPKQHDLDFLMKIIESGLKYSKNDFALVNTAEFPINQIFDEIPFNYVISFGVDSLHLDSSVSLYEIHDNQGKKELYVDTLGKINSDQSLKMQLWKALKTMFHI